MKLLQGDNLPLLKLMPDNSVDSIVTDPPYGLSFMGKKWDYDVPTVELWQEVLRVLKPGGHLLSFAGSRTYHRMAVNIEDAGFDIRDQIMWVYGSGFPKSHNIGKAVDKLQGNEREVVGKTQGQGTPVHNGNYKTGEQHITKGNSPYEGLGTALKPAHEPIVVARKPFKGTVAANVLKYGTGGINIADCRVEGSKPSVPQPAGKTGDIYGFKNGKGRSGEMSDNSQGRFPANFIHDGSDEVVGLFPDSKSGGAIKAPKTSKGIWGNAAQQNWSGFSDSGSAARFFKKCEFTNEEMAEIFHNTYERLAPKFEYETRDETKRLDFDSKNGKLMIAVMEELFASKETAQRFKYQAKASKKDRNEGLEGFEEKDSTARQVSSEWKVDSRHPDGGYETAPQAKANNSHPTVKPTKLMQYLVRLVTPKDGTVLDPFMGSGSTGKACVLENFDFIGMEMDEDYCRIAKARIQAVKDKPTQQELLKKT